MDVIDNREVLHNAIETAIATMPVKNRSEAGMVAHLLVHTVMVDATVDAVLRQLEQRVEEANARFAAIEGLRGTVDPNGGDGYQPGAWDEVRGCYMDGHLTETAYEEIHTALWGPWHE